MKGRRIVSGQASAEAIVSKHALSFFGGVDPKTGIVIDHDHELRGQSIKGKVLIFPRGKGSTVGSYVIYALRKYDVAPTAILNVETEPIIIGGCVLASIPLVDRLDKDPTDVVQTGDWVTVNADTGVVVVTKHSSRGGGLREN
jgi:predicted aconitase with swiveling domain